MNKEEYIRRILEDDETIYKDEGKETRKIQLYHVFMRSAILSALLLALDKEPYDIISKKNVEKLEIEIRTELNRLEPSVRDYYYKSFNQPIRQTVESVTINTAKKSMLKYKIDAFKSMQKYFDRLGDSKLYKTTINKKWNEISYIERFHGKGIEDIEVLEKLLKDVLINNKRPQDFAKDLDKLINKGQYHAERLLRTESTGMVTGMRLEEYSRLGYTSVMVLSSMTATTCDYCRNYDHSIVSILNANIGINIPPLHPNCKCVIVPYK